MHLAEEQIQRLLHGELSGSAAPEIQEHLAVCSECRNRVQEAEREDQWMIAQLAALDHPAPTLQAADIIRAARSSHPHGWGRWAAGIFLAAALAGGAYAAPGSPLPGVLARLLTSDGDTPSSVAPPPERTTAQAGVAVAPGKRLTISFRNGVPGDSAAISLSDRDEVVIQAQGGQSSFRSDSDRLIIDHRGDRAQFEILIPRSAPLVEVEMDGRRIFLKQGSGITGSVAADSLGRYVIPLVSRP
ncbi:MAG TPA: zf-HC2 domain-containing protein [Gemmatimonadales bacterium]|nr:zf-HC2 domain-containing protein [Gemmatimonadales bacterium]